MGSHRRHLRSCFRAGYDGHDIAAKGWLRLQEQPLLSIDIQTDTVGGEAGGQCRRHPGNEGASQRGGSSQNYLRSVLLNQLDELLRQKVFLVVRQFGTIDKIDFVGTMGYQTVDIIDFMSQTYGAQFRL